MHLSSIYLSFHPSVYPFFPCAVSRVSKQLMLLETDNQRLQEEVDESRREARQSEREVLTLKTRLQDAVTWDEHCSISGKLRRYGVALPPPGRVMISLP